MLIVVIASTSISVFFGVGFFFNTERGGCQECTARDGGAGRYDSANERLLVRHMDIRKDFGIMFSKRIVDCIA